MLLVPRSLVFVALIVASVPAQTRFAPQVRGHLGLAHGDSRPTEVNDYRFGDVDGDGDRDLVAIRNFGAAELWRNDGHGVFTTAEYIRAPLSGSYRRAALGDVDGDLDLDCVLLPGVGAGYGSPGQVQLMLNDGSGRFGDAPAQSLPGDIVDGAFVLLADLDGDGDRDLLIVGEFVPSRALGLWINDGAGRFTDETASRLPVIAGFPMIFMAATLDIDGDGDRDILFNGSGVNRLLVNDGGGTFVDQSAWLPGGSGAAVWGFGDLDGDGDVDLIRDSSVLYNDGTGRNYQSQASGVTVNHEVSVTDCDGDGRQDLVGVSPTGVPFVYLRQVAGGFVDASAAWMAPYLLVDPTTYNGLPEVTHCVEDVDGDGDPDLLIGGGEGRAHSSFTVGIPPKLLINSGDRLVDGSRRSLPFQQIATQAIATGDVDGDGDEDLFFAHEPAYTLQSYHEALWLNDGDGMFERGGALPNWPVTGADMCTAAAFVDVDRDGDLDLVTGRGWPWNSPPGKAANRLALNDGSGGFTEAAFPAVADATASLAYGDVDGDGDVDLVFGNQDDGFFSGLGAQNRLFLNDGSGGFVDATAGRLPAIADVTLEVVLADMDGDGDLDLVVGNGPYLTNGGPADGVRLLRNDGTGVFTDASAGRLPPQAAAVAMAVGDVDGDGDLDIALRRKDLLNDGTGHFTERVTATSARAVRIVLGDLDGDGADERVEGGEEGAAIDGRGVWYARENQVREIALVDVDGDDDLDAVLTVTQEFSPADDSLFSIGVLRNQSRQVRAVGLLRAGRPYRLTFRAVNGAAGATLLGPVLGLGVLAPRVRLAGWGRFGVDPSPALLALPAVTVPNADTAASLTLSVPADPALIDQAIAVQALAVPVGNPLGVHFTNVVVGRVLE